MTNKSMSDFQFKEFLRLVTAKEYLLCSEVMQSYRKETFYMIFPQIDNNPKHLCGISRNEL